jgi:hypothetical protein
MRIGSKEERSLILDQLTQSLIAAKCTDLDTLREVDRLCRRTWDPIHRGWVLWSHYLEGILAGAYLEWVRSNCRKVE